MDSRIKKAILFFLLFFAILALLSQYTQAHTLFSSISLLPLFLAVLAILFSVFFWILAWLIILNKKPKKLFLIGFFSAFASLTPVQLGADLMRAHYSNKLLKIPLTKTLSASILVKGFKFALISLSATFLFLTLFLQINDSFFKFLFLTGFLIVLLATLLFILPINSTFASHLSSFFSKHKKIPFSNYLYQLFRDYPKNFHSIPFKTLIFSFILSLFSLICEFLALFFIFPSLLIQISLFNLACLFIIISILERNPFFPKGIGLIEATASLYLSLFALPLAQIGAIIILYDFIRIFVPYSLSLLTYLIFKFQTKSNYL